MLSPGVGPKSFADFKRCDKTHVEVDKPVWVPQPFQRAAVGLMLAAVSFIRLAAGLNEHALEGVVLFRTPRGNRLQVNSEPPRATQPVAACKCVAKLGGHVTSTFSRPNDKTYRRRAVRSLSVGRRSKCFGPE
jgi:hypothetical protein